MYCFLDESTDGLGKGEGADGMVHSDVTSGH